MVRGRERRAACPQSCRTALRPRETRFPILSGSRQLPPTFLFQAGTVHPGSRYSILQTNANAQTRSCRRPKPFLIFALAWHGVATSVQMPRTQISFGPPQTGTAPLPGMPAIQTRGTFYSQQVQRHPPWADKLHLHH